MQLLCLMVAKKALEKAGYAEMSPHESENTAVIFGGEGMADLSARTGFRSSYRQYIGEGFVDQGCVADVSLEKGEFALGRRHVVG